LFICRNQLTGALGLRDKVLLHEADESVCVRITLELKVESVVLLLDTDSFVVSVVSQNKLLQIEHRALVGDSLPDLNLGCPCMRSVRCLAIIALLVRHGEFDHEGLLQHRVGLHFFLHGDLHLDSARVGFCPHKGSFKQLHSLKPFDVFKAERKQLSALKISLGPRGSKIAVALTTVVQDVAPGDALRNIDLAF
jgi:hypothetical protein